MIVKAQVLLAAQATGALAAAAAMVIAPPRVQAGLTDPQDLGPPLQVLAVMGPTRLTLLVVLWRVLPLTGPTDTTRTDLPKAGISEACTIIVVEDADISHLQLPHLPLLLRITTRLTDPVRSYVQTPVKQWLVKT